MNINRERLHAQIPLAKLSPSYLFPSSIESQIQDSGKDFLTWEGIFVVKELDAAIAITGTIPPSKPESRNPSNIVPN